MPYTAGTSHGSRGADIRRHVTPPSPCIPRCSGFNIGIRGWCKWSLTKWVEIKVKLFRWEISSKARILSDRVTTVSESQKKARSQVSTNILVTVLSPMAASSFLFRCYILATAKIIEQWDSNHGIVVIYTYLSLGILLTFNRLKLQIAKILQNHRDLSSPGAYIHINCKDR